MSQQVEIINEAIKADPQRLLDDLGIEIDINYGKISSYCMIHEGDKNSAMNVNFEKGYWSCYTKHCEGVFRNSLIGWVRGMLSSRNCRWKAKGDKIYPWKATIDYLTRLYGINGFQKLTPEDEERNKYIKGCSNGYKIEKNITSFPLQNYLKLYTAKPEYFINRGFSCEVLEKYDVRYCDRPNSKYFRRCMVPLLDVSNRNIIGISGRSTCDEVPKWKHSYNFPGSTSLYNYGFAGEYIRRNHIAILVESPANVWRLEEAGIHNGLALWGNTLTDYKRYLLDQLGVMKIVLALDNDEAGKLGCENIKNKVGRLYNISEIVLPDEVNDIADLTISEVQKLFKGIV